MEQMTLVDFVRSGLVQEFENGNINAWIAGYAERGEVQMIEIASVNMRMENDLFAHGYSSLVVLSVERKQPATEAQAAEDTATAATAGEREADTVHVYPGIDKQGYDILSGGRLDTWRYEKGDAFEYALVLANDNIRALQAELATARKQVTALTGAIKTALEFVSSAWDKNDASVVVKDYRYLTETLNFTEAALQDVLFKSDEK